MTINKVLKNQRLNWHDSAVVDGSLSSKIAKKTPLFEATYLQTALKNDCLKTHFMTLPLDNALPKDNLSVLHFATMSSSSTSPNITNLINKASTLNTTASNQGSQEKLTSIDGFLKLVWPFMKQAAALIGLDPKVLIAQAALETGWGKWIAHDEEGKSSHNLFNIKATADKEPKVKIKTTEFVEGKAVKTEALFKQYASIEESVFDYITLLTHNGRYKAALAQTHEPSQYLHALQAAGYATDPHYAQKILSIYNSTQFALLTVP